METEKKCCGGSSGQPVQGSRLAICTACTESDWSVDGGVCNTIAAKHGAEKANIEHGIKRASLSCPLAKWHAEPTQCPVCNRAAMQVIPEAIGMCSWCQLKKIHNRPRAVGIAGGMQYNARKDFSLKPIPFASVPIRHLHFFLYPRYLESTLWHLDRLERSINTFNGQRVCCVATDGDTIHNEVRDRMERIFSSVYYVANDPKKREAVGFIRSLEALESISQNEAICFAHGKGQQHGTSVCPLIRKWIEASYETVVENWDEVRPAMEAGYPLAGSFKLLGSFRNTQYKWHYSGSYWWGRSSSIFSNPGWRRTCNHWWASESYVGRHWHASEGYCLFADNIAMGSPYLHATWTNRLDAELEQWRNQKYVTAE